MLKTDSIRNLSIRSRELAGILTETADLTAGITSTLTGLDESLRTPTQQQAKAIHDCIESLQEVCKAAIAIERESSRLVNVFWATTPREVGESPNDA